MYLNIFSINFAGGDVITLSLTKDFSLKNEKKKYCLLKNDSFRFCILVSGQDIKWRLEFEPKSFMYVY